MHSSEHRPSSSGQEEFKVREEHICYICGSFTLRKNALKAHIFRHAHIDNYNCDKCKESFVYKEKLESHQAKFHAILAEWKCDICEKSFEGPHI